MRERRGAFGEAGFGKVLRSNLTASAMPLQNKVHQNRVLPLRHWTLAQPLVMTALEFRVAFEMFYRES